MKVDPTRNLRNISQSLEPEAKPASEAMRQNSEIKQNIQGAQKEAINAKGNMDLSANVTQSKLQNMWKDNPGTKVVKEAVMENAAKLKPFLPDLIRKSQNNPDKLLEGIREKVDPHNLGSLADGDIMAMAFIVMMEAAKSAREDLKSIMDEVKNINAAKEKLRSFMSQLKGGSDSSDDDSDDP